MQRLFSQALVGLYDLAEQTSHNDFPVQALSLLRPWIKFEGAVLWMSELDAGVVSNFLVAHVHGLQEHKAIFGSYAKLSSMDALTKRFRSRLKHPIRWSSNTPNRHIHLHEFEESVRKGELQHVMLFGENPTSNKLGHWLVLYRTGKTAFTELEAKYLHAAWFHLVRSLDINRSRVLDRHDPGRMQRALALIDPRGFILVADFCFNALLCREWPEHQVKRLPEAILNGLMEGGNVFRGRRIEIILVQQSGYFTCSASAIEMGSDLTPSEYMVARRYATGLSHKEIARELGVSPHTVRNQIAHLYDKLGVHDKAMLAQHLARHIEHGRIAAREGN